MLISLSKVSNLFQNGQFPMQPILAAILVTIATVKVKILPEVCTRAIVLIKIKEEMGKINSYFLAS